MRAVQRGRGPSGGRVASKRGRIRKRGPSGGGTLRRKSPQEGQRPSLATGPATSARSQWPRASHSGLMHCTVKPGRYCIASPQRPQSPVVARPPTRRLTPLLRQANRGGPQRKTLRERGTRAGGQEPGTAREQRILPWRSLGVKKKTPQDIGVRLQLCKTGLDLRENRRQNPGRGAAEILRRFSLTIRNSS
jgi:hypothetical protein